MLRIKGFKDSRIQGFKGVKKIIFIILLTAIAIIPHRAFLVPPPANMADYTAYPPFVTESAPPLVMLAMGRDHKLYYEAYNDASDLDEDGRLDVGYKHSIDYYGYFDPYKCYSYSGSGANAKFVPVSTTSNKYCSGAWSGNFLNWISMSRMDVIKKIFYGGYRSSDSSSETVLEGAYIPQDAHSWGKEYSGSDTPKLTPFSTPDSGKRHLFCVTSLKEGDPHVIRVAKNDTNRIWNWASTERAICSGPDTPSSWRHGPVGTRNDIQDYYVRVKVCDPTVGLETSCKYYPGGGGVYKPQGLLQKYGEGDGSKVCSKAYTKACNTNSDCSSGEGICIDKVQMYFGLITGSYTKNLTGGVLRKNVWGIRNEINTNTGTFQTSENVEGNIIITLDRLKTIGFRYSDYSYQDPGGGNCGWITTRALNEGECRMWGNPVAEIMYEATRYFADKGSPTSDFEYSGTQDSGIKLSKPDWIRPYNIYPSCSKPFILTFSDINPSYDSDKVPGTSFGSFSGDLPGLDVSTLSNTIGTFEGLAGTDRFIGQSGGLYDFICSKKYVSNLSTIRGLCPEEPTKQGSYYSAAIAYYGKTMMKEKTDRPNINTYTVALASPVPDINIKVGGNNVRLVPTGKSVSGCLGVYGACAQKCTLTYGSNGLLISNCSSDAYCPTNTIVDFYVDTITYDASNNITYAKFRINFEDVEQGADHDMDAVVTYEIQPVGSNQIQVKLSSDYAYGCIDQALGFVISGTTEDGVYLPVKDADADFDGNRSVCTTGSGADGDTPTVVANMACTWTKTFTVSGSTAGLLKDPLWYAAKWGGFEDFNSSGRPDSTSEWDSDGNGIPDTYFLVVNPFKLEQQLEKAFADILRRTASGTAVSVLATAGEGEGAVYQTYFYPKRLEGAEERKWLGYIHSLFLDPYGNIREDTNGDKTLSLTGDYVVKTEYSTALGTVVKRYRDTVGNGDPDDFQYVDTIPLDNVHSIWNGGKRLWETSPSDRIIYSTTNGSTRIDFRDSAKSTLRPYLRANDNTEAGNIINYIRGQDITGYRKRTITIDGQTKVWKLGDIVYSTSTAVSRPMENYDLIYGDSSYSTFRQKYLNRRHVVYVGANDGMLHAFNGGFSSYDANNNLQFSGGGRELGDELWAFIPRELLPHLKWLTDPNYTHVYYVDLKPKVTDVKIFSDDATHPGGWGTILIGGMRYGGKTISTEAGDFSSAFFALDITDPLNPRLLWTFSTTDLGLTMSYPAVAKVGNDWYAIFGSGPTNFDILSNLTGFQKGKIFVLKISGGSNGVISSWTENTNYWKISTGNSNAFMANPITIDVNIDSNVDVAYIGENYKQGTNRKATMWRLTNIGGAVSLTELYNVDSASDISKRITASPSAAKDKKGNLWIYFGTGQFFGIGDRNQSDTGAFYGIKDGCWNGSCSTTYSNLLDVSDAVVGVGGGTVTGVTGASNWTELLNTMSTKDGWAIYFNNMPAETTDFLGNTLQHQGERVTTKAAILKGLILFATYIPGGDICTVEGTSNLYVLYYETGTAYKDYVFKKEKELATPTVSRSALLGKGLPASIGIAVTSEGKIKGFAQSSTGDIQQIEEIGLKAQRSGYVGWKAGGL